MLVYSNSKQTMDDDCCAECTEDMLNVIVLFPYSTEDALFR